MSNILTLAQQSMRHLRIFGFSTLIATFGLAIPVTTFSAPSCANVFLSAESGPRTFLATSQIYDPYVVRVGPYTHPLNYHMMVNHGIVGEPWERGSLIPYKHPLFGVIRSQYTARHNESLDAIYGSYGSRLSAEAQKAVRDVEYGLATNRISLISIELQNRPDEIFGFLRIFDGTGYGPVEHDFVLKYASDPRLPMEHIAAIEGRTIPIVQRDREALESIFELGKYYIAKKVTRGERDAIRRQLLGWLRGNLGKFEEAHTVLYVDVGSETHRDLYERDFGFTAVTDPALNGGMEPPNYVLRAPLSVLKAHLDQALAGHP